MSCLLSEGLGDDLLVVEMTSLWGSTWYFSIKPKNLKTALLLWRGFIAGRKFGYQIGGEFPKTFDKKIWPVL